MSTTGIDETMEVTDALPTAEDFLELERKFKSLCMSVFGSGQGKELLGQLERIYVDGKLFQDSDRDTVYCVAQRDLIMELKYNSKGEL